MVFADYYRYPYRALGLWKDEPVSRVLDLQTLPIYFVTPLGRATHIFVGKLVIIGSDNGLSPWRHQSSIWTNAGILLIGHLGTFNRNSNIFIQANSFETVWETAAIFSWPQCVYRIKTEHPFLVEVSARRRGRWKGHLTEAIAESESGNFNQDLDERS